MNQEDKDFIERARKVLQQSTDEIDDATRASLTRARWQALNRPRKGLRWQDWGAAPLAGLALAAMLIFLWWPAGTRLESNYVGDLGLLASEDSIEFYEEIDFCLWLSEDSDETTDFSDATGRPIPWPAAAWAGLGRPAGRTAGEPTGSGITGISGHLRGSGDGLARPFHNTARG